MQLINFIQFIFQFLIILGGALAVLIITINGILYIVSSGKPERLKEARSRILSAFLGLVVLVSSWLILNTISPELLTLKPPGVNNNIPTPPPGPGPSEVSLPPRLQELKKIIEETKKISEEIEKNAQEIYNLTKDCRCENTLSLCLCTGGSPNSFCQAYQCYVGADNKNHPCPEIENLNDSLKEIINKKNIISYYGTRITSKGLYLSAEIESVINKKIDYFENAIKTEKEMKYPQQIIIDIAREALNKLKAEKKYKAEIKNYLIALRVLDPETRKKVGGPLSEIEKMTILIDVLVKLPEQCLSGINEKCVASCKKGQEYGCHDKSEGCQPDLCKAKNRRDPNPCPIKDIEKQFKNIGKLSFKIKDISNQIINNINKLNSLSSKI